MAQQQLAASLIAQGIDPRQLGPRLPPPGPRPGQIPGPPGPPMSPSRVGPVPPGPGLPPSFVGLFGPGLPGGPGQAPGQAPGPGPLSRFFSPEVLAQAQSGHVPAMPPMPTPQQKVLTLEEIERQAAAVRM